MDYAQYQRKSGRNATGLTIVLILHLLLGWALVSGLARKVVEVIKAPIETKIIEEVKPPPPPPPPDNLPPPPKFAPPPPSFVPPPEVQVTPPPNPAPVITTTQVAPPPAPVTIAPPPKPDAPPAPPAPAAPPAPKAPPVRVAPSVNFANDCEKPEYPSAAARAEVTGITVVRVSVGVDGRVTGVEVTKTSGNSREHKALDRAALAAIRDTCKFKAGTVDGKPEPLTTEVRYEWKLD